MKVSTQSQLRFRLQQVAFYVLLVMAIVLLSKLAITTNQTYDLTANNQHSLSDSSLKILQTLNTPVAVNVFVSPDYEYYSAVTELINRYQQHTEKLNVKFIDPAFAPEKVRQFNIQQQGEIVIQKDSNSEHVFDLSEQSFTNALISVARKQHDWIIFISGHGERSIDDNSDFGLSTWHKNLQSKGFKIRSQNLIDSPQIPINTKLLVIASPEKPWLAGEINIIKQYLQNGGNLLWLNAPSSSAFLRPLAEQLGIEFIPGTVLDPNAKMLGLDDPRFVLITDYANHPVGLAVKSVTLLAEGSAIQQLNETSKDEWHYTNLLNSQPDAWVESHRTDESTAKTQTFNEGKDVHGPVSLGMLIERAKPENTDKFQRIAVIGDADFVANSYVGNVANLDLGMALINWLAEDDTFLSIPVKTSIGTQLTLSNTQSLIIGFGFLFVLPGVLLLIGFLLWWRRRRR